MAKKGEHLVKCLYCNEYFNALTTPYIKPISTRYAHVDCAKAHGFTDEDIRTDTVEKEKELTQEAQDKLDLEAYIKEVLGVQFLGANVGLQIRKFHNKGMTYTGMKKALQYFYEVKHGDKEKAHGGIGIVEYVYEDAKQYYYKLWLAEQKGQNPAEKVEQQIKEITIPAPQRNIKKPKLFSFLDEE